MYTFIVDSDDIAERTVCKLLSTSACVPESTVAVTAVTPQVAGDVISSSLATRPSQILPRACVVQLMIRL